MLTTVIDAKFMGYYYAMQGESELKESPQSLEKRYVFWNHMTNLSLQNTVSQIINAKKVA